MPINAKDMLAKLKSDPVKFLRQNALGIGGQASGIKDCYLSERQGGFPGELTIANFQPPNLPNTEWVKFSAHVVGVARSEATDVTIITPYVLTAQGPDIMITAQLSGCSFCMLPHKNGQELLCAHIQPRAAGNYGKELQDSLVSLGRFASVPDKEIVVYGKYDYKDYRSIVIGVRKGGRWAIYTQQRTVESVIKAALQIFPE